jgi:hypothetical protein
LSRYSRSAFWLIVEGLGVTPEEICRALELMVEQWFSMSASKEIAKEELEQRRRELHALRLQTNAFPIAGTEYQAP